MISYEFLCDKGLFLARLSGNIEKSTLISFLEHLFQDKAITKISKALMDYRDSVFKIAISELDDIAKVRMNHANILKNVQTVHMVGTSYETAFATLFSTKIPAQVADIAVCSTLSRAIQLLDMDFTVGALEGRLQNLAFKY